MVIQEDSRNRDPQPLFFDFQKDSSVLIPIIEEDRNLSILFEIRASSLIHQPEEICFPGGRCERGETPEQTAIRETCEELLISTDDMEILAPLDYFISYAGFKVTPFLRKIKSYSGSYSSDEVKSIFTVPIRFFLEYEPESFDADICVRTGEDFSYERISRGKDYPFAKGKLFMPFYEYEGRVIWGLTGRLLAGNIQLIRSVLYREGMMIHPFKHLKTISRHKYEVWKLCIQAGIPFQGLMHDLSKYSPAEFFPGARFWVGDKSPQVLERERYGFSGAWMHHKGKNKHHFEYWTDYVSGIGITTIEMPPKYLAEMFCDRVAASKVYQGDAYTDASPLEYFQWARKHYVMHEKTIEALEKLLVMLKEKGEKETLSYIRHNIVFSSKKSKNHFS